MRTLSHKQIEFFSALGEIQEAAVNVALCNKTDNVESLLYNATYDAICSIMELIDGYVKESIRIDLTDANDGESISKGIQLHGECVNFLKYQEAKL